MTAEHVSRVRAAMQRQLVHAILDNDRVARAHGLRVSDLQTLHLLVLREDVRTPRRVSAVTGMPPSTVTKLIDRLEAAGCIRRIPDPHDRRRTILELVPEAIAPLRASYADADREFDQLSSRFTTTELTAVTRYLDAVSDFYARRASAELDAGGHA